MGKIIINGREDSALSKLLGGEFITLATTAADIDDNAFSGADISLTCAANSILGDTMSARNFFEKIKNLKVTTLMQADAAKEMLETNWLMYMGMVLPYVDVYFSSYQDALWLFERDLYEEYQNLPDSELCDQIALSILNMGCALVVIDLGKNGVYLRSSSVKPRLESMGACSPSDIDQWWARELYAPSTDTQNTTSKLAALVSALQQQASPEAACTSVAGSSDLQKVPATFAQWKSQTTVLTGPFDKVEA